MSPKISVLCPVYNGEARLAAAVESIRRQTEPDWELLLLDDGSRDGSAALCARLAASDGRIRHLAHDHNRGLGAAMVTLAAAARGPYLAIQEQDDVSAPQRLERELEILETHPEIGLVSGVAEWLDASGRRLALFPAILAAGGQYPQERRAMVRYLMLEQCKVVNAGAMFRRALLDDPAIFFDHEARMSVDWQFFLRVAHRTGIWGLPDLVVHMDRGADRGSLTRRKELQFTEARRCLRIAVETWQDDPGSPIDRRLYRHAMATQLLLEGRYYGRFLGAWRHLQAWVLDPVRREIVTSLMGLALGRWWRRPRRELSGS